MRARAAAVVSGFRGPSHSLLTSFRPKQQTMAELIGALRAEASRCIARGIRIGGEWRELPGVWAQWAADAAEEAVALYVQTFFSIGDLQEVAREIPEAIRIAMLGEFAASLEEAEDAWNYACDLADEAVRQMDLWEWV